MSSSKSKRTGRASTQPDQLKHLAEEVVSTLDQVSNAAKEEFEKAPSQGGGATKLAYANTLNTPAAAKNVDSAQTLVKQQLAKLISEPAIARIEIKGEDGLEQVCFVTRSGTLPQAPSGVRMASYRSPIGRLAALSVGTDEDVLTPQGLRNFQLLARAELHPKHENACWDSVDTVVHALGRKPATIASLRQLFVEKADDGDYLDELIEADRAAQNVHEGVRRRLVTKMALRDQPLLDQIQDRIFRLPLDSRLAVLGPPGTGKTTTLIKRLGQKLDSQALDASEERAVARTLAGKGGHSQSWMMFTPTELLKLYVKEAFAREGIAASDERIKTWDDYRRELARNSLGILRTDANSGTFILRPQLDPFQRGALDRQIAWFEEFEEWHARFFWNELAMQAEILAKDMKLERLGIRLRDAVGGDRESVEKLIAISGLGEELQQHADQLKVLAEEKIRAGLGRVLKTDTGAIDRVSDLLAKLEDQSEDTDDLDQEEEDAGPKPTDRAAAIDACFRSVRAQARAAALGRALSRSARPRQVIDAIGATVLAPDELKTVGEYLVLQSAVRRFVFPVRRYVLGIPRRYRNFRRECQAAGEWYQKSGFAQADITPLEADAIMLAMLRAARSLLRDSRVSTNLEKGAYSVLGGVQTLFRTQMSVDEATDFSPIQLACMAALCDPVTNSFFVCGDFNQRITRWGARSVDELKWAAPEIQVETIDISYRHSQQLNELAHKIALLSDRRAKKTALPHGVENEGVKPVLVKGLRDSSRIADWLSGRIREIERLTRSLPSIAILVNKEADVDPLAEALGQLLEERSIKVVACAKGKSVGQDNDVRVFDVQHIKGLEFEAVFFVGVDDLAEASPDLFDKYLYVGATRAAMFLGIIVGGNRLPTAIKPFEGLFVSDWAKASMLQRDASLPKRGG